MEWTWKIGEEGIKQTKREKKIDNNIANDNIVNEVLDFKDEIIEEKKRLMKEEGNKKLSNRGLLIQRSVNPYMINNDYNKDLEIQHEFLMPKDSNQ
jgi:hypothetical protein